MKKMIGTKVKRTIAGQLAFATAMIFSLPGNMMAQQAPTITAPSIDDVTYSTTSFSVAATSSSGLAVKLRRGRAGNRRALAGSADHDRQGFCHGFLLSEW